MNEDQEKRFPTLKINLNQKYLRRLDLREDLDNSKPYLWNIFFKIDGSCINIEKDFTLKGQVDFQFSEGSHGNLGIDTLHAQHSVSIPQSVGQFQTTLEPLHIPYFEAKTSGIVGLISILMEENNVSSKGAEAGHRALNEQVKITMNKLIREFDPQKVDVHNLDESIETYFKSRSEQYASEIESVIGTAVKNEQNIIQNIWSLLHRDTLIGYEIWKFSTEELMLSKGAMEFSKKWITDRGEEWQIDGELLSKKTPVSENENR